jgi:mRNA interferase MazF
MLWAERPRLIALTRGRAAGSALARACEPPRVGRSHRCHEPRGGRLGAISGCAGVIRAGGCRYGPGAQRVVARAGAVDVAQGDVWWAELSAPTGSGTGFRRPVVVVQGDSLNRSRIATVVCIPLTSNLRWADAPGNVMLAARTTGLPQDSVANASQFVALDRTVLTSRVGRIGSRRVAQLLSGIDVVLGR